MKRSSCLLFSFLFWLLAQNLIGKYLLVNLQEELGQDKDTNGLKKTPSRAWRNGLDLVDPKLDQRVPANGGWTEWFPWSECSNYCGTGEQFSERYLCLKPLSSYGGKQCEKRIRMKNCDLGPCPVDCTWSEWSPWDDYDCLQMSKHFACLKKHRQDRTMRRRRVVMEMEMYGGRPCKTNDGKIITDHDYRDIVEKPCQTPRCP